jgi:heat shock protein HtpX
MRELVQKNKRRSWILVASFLVLIAILGYLLSYFSEGGSLLLIVALVFGIISVLTSYYAGDKLILASVGAKQIEISDDPELYRIVENLSITAGIPMPKLYVIDDAALNAFATGRDPEHASVAITTGLRRALNRQELEAVMAHEISHVNNYDIRLMLLTAVLVGMIIFLSDILWRISLGGRRDSKKGGGPLILIAVILGLVGAPLAAQLIKLAVSRKREFLADASSALLTRYPEGMISALKKIAQAPRLQGHHDSIAHLFIYPPVEKKASLRQKLFSTHPPISERIAALQESARIRE